MNAYQIESSGYIFWGTDANQIVARMRRAEFGGDYPTNRTYIRAVARRLRDQGHDVTHLAAAEEQDFLDKLVGLGLFVRVTEEFLCPIAQAFCRDKRESCVRMCWIKKQERQGDELNDKDQSGPTKPRN